MFPMTPNEYKLLYTDEDGVVVGLDEVQLIDPPIIERVPALIDLLDSTNHLVVYESALILSAWGFDFGVDKIELMIDSDSSLPVELSPNRINGEDNCFDEMAYAIYLYGLSGGSMTKVKELFCKFLKIYPRHFFESKLKYVLLKSNICELADDVCMAIITTHKNGRIYQAGQLLPVLSLYNPSKGWGVISDLITNKDLMPYLAVNIAESLKFIKTMESLDLLRSLMQFSRSEVADEVQNSLSVLADRF